MPSNMSSHKRKRPQHDEEEEDGSEYFSEVSVDPSDDDEIDISSALTGKRIRAKVSKPGSGQGPINNGKDVSSDEDEGKRVVKSAREKRLEEMEGAGKQMDNALKINDWVAISNGA